MVDLSRMKASETTEQIKLFSWAKANEDQFPELRNMFHVPNEGKRTNGAVLTAAGMKEGVPDILLLASRNNMHGLAIEMKYGKNKTTAKQKEWLERLNNYGYRTCVCYRMEECHAIHIRQGLNAGGGGTNWRR